MCFVEKLRAISTAFPKKGTPQYKTPFGAFLRENRKKYSQNRPFALCFVGYWLLSYWLIVISTNNQ
jgi:hypothetical protein